MFLEEGKYVLKKKRHLSLFIINDIEISYVDSDRENSDEEILMKKIPMKKI